MSTKPSGARLPTADKIAEINRRHLIDTPLEPADLLFVFGTREDVALRARYHYEQAHSPMLTFYIVLHQAIMRLMMGDAITARKHAADAAQCLQRVPFESPNDARLVTLLDACVELTSIRMPEAAQ